MTPQPNAEQQAELAEYARKKVVGLRSTACKFEGAAIDSPANLTIDEAKELAAFQRGCADKCRKCADEIESALNAGEPGVKVLEFINRLLADCLTGMITGDPDQAQIIPRPDDGGA